MMLLANVFSLVLACLVGVGPVALVAALQNRRDRRAGDLFHEAAKQLPAEALRSDIALSVRCRLFSRGATVQLDLGTTSSPHIWETAARLRRGLPPWVRLEVDGQVDGPLAVLRPVHITVESPAPETLRRAA
jgi:hypothetical protein